MTLVELKRITVVRSGSVDTEKLPKCLVTKGGLNYTRNDTRTQFRLQTHSGVSI